MNSDVDHTNIASFLPSMLRRYLKTMTNKYIVRKLIYRHKD